MSLCGMLGPWGQRHMTKLFYLNCIVRASTLVSKKHSKDHWSAVACAPVPFDDISLLLPWALMDWMDILVALWYGYISHDTLYVLTEKRLFYFFLFLLFSIHDALKALDFF
ncbi:hypothetical protein ACJX0J_038050, partial [Zea mays]